ncbi:hypothetical protein MPNT_330010 [Candidatus Methylacidithermus pantelleriae]|uniref:Uncharacterized protein n=1 Tax=Candidatus Methylacidithermus pantelleriae TaxID=2744239 RepID=A0A8J2BUG9_9BACT|nr:hypothetical protein MPNT_330010 [Candidatus Methylacidithermus pantelleriae]
MAYQGIWCPKDGRDVLTGAVANQTGAIVDAIYAEAG